jgi:hypothetical protein
MHHLTAFDFGSYKARVILGYRLCRGLRGGAYSPLMDPEQCTPAGAWSNR